MAFPKVGKFAPVNLGHMRAHDCRDLLVYCNSCHNTLTLNVGHLSDDTPDQIARRLRRLLACGEAAEIQPDWGRGPA